MLNAFVKMARAIEAASDELALAQAASSGCPAGYARQDIGYAAYTLRHFDRHLGLLRERGLVGDDHVGKGAIAVQLPYNTPLSAFALSFASARAFEANRVVVKFPSSCAGLVKVLSEVLAAADEAILKNADGSSILSAAPGPAFLADAITAGASVVQTYGHPKMVTPRLLSALRAGRTDFIMEGPGNNPAIVAPGADVEAAAKTIAHLRTANSGQLCMGVETAYVHEEVAEETLRHLKEELSAQPLGPAEEWATAVAPVPMASAATAMRLVAAAKAEGAEHWIATPAPEEAPRPGYEWVVPQLLIGVTPLSAITEQEKFCPALPIRIWTDEDDLIHELMAKRYFLAATLYSGGDDGVASLRTYLERAYGNVFLDRDTLDPAVGFDVLMDPWGGYGDSRFRLGSHLARGRRVFTRVEGPSYLATEFSEAAGPGA